MESLLGTLLQAVGVYVLDDGRDEAVVLLQVLPNKVSRRLMSLPENDNLADHETGKAKSPAVSLRWG